MVFPILGIIIACLSLPLVVYAGERTIRRTITRPQLFRSVSAPQKPSERLVGKMAEGRPATPRRKTTSSLGEEGPVRADTNASEASWLSTSTAETYVRGMSLEKVGLD
ncbi:hypothetical protein DFP73DRAFT_210669 [Morchella snyderi]|nr:hypothetical protein DFP73DRAFT_210669 [Morchella snyderi]